MNLLAGKRLYCPYCYEGFTEQQIEFRCTGQISRTGERCYPDADEALRERTGFTGALPPTFAADGRLASAECPRCRDDSTIRVCPVCHSQLPVFFGKVRSRLIGLVGAKESGKTVYMTVLVRELTHQLGAQLHASILGADDSTRQRFPTDYEQPLYRERRLPTPTTPAGMYRRAPLVFRFTTERSGPLHRARPERQDWCGHGEPRHTLMSFFDPAGEELRSQQAAEDSARYLAAADGILLLLDPLQMRGARARAAADSRMPTSSTPADEPVNVLTSITDLILSRNGKPKQRISKPLAIAFSKMDVLLHDLKPTSPLLRTPAQVPYLDERESRAVHTEMQRLLAEWEGAQIDQVARRHYRHYRYFGVSALGESPTDDNRGPARGIRPYRVGSPFVWLLAELGAIPVKRG